MMHILTVFVTILTTCVCAMVFTKKQTLVTVAFFLLHMSYSSLIILGVFGINKSIKKLGNGFTNNRLTTLHIFNFIVFGTIFMARTILQIRCQPEEVLVRTEDPKINRLQITTNIIHAVEIVFAFYIMLFLIYLNMKFAYK